MFTEEFIISGQTKKQRYSRCQTWPWPRSLHAIIGGTKMINYQESSSKSLFRLLFLKDETLCSNYPWHQQKKAGEYVGTHTTFRSLIPGYKLVESRVVSPEST